MKRLLVAAAGTAMIFGCAAIPRESANQAALAEARPLGEPRNCISLTTISHTRVRSDSVIDFYMRGGQVYRNALPASCPGLAFEERFTYRTSLSQLCAVDTITVLYASGPQQGATCGLGRFQPIEIRARRG